MLNKLKQILNTYTKEQLEDMELWIDCSDNIKEIIIDENGITLVTDSAELKINGKTF